MFGRAKPILYRKRITLLEPKAIKLNATSIEHIVGVWTFVIGLSHISSYSHIIVTEIMDDTWVLSKNPD